MLVFYQFLFPHAQGNKKVCLVDRFLAHVSYDRLDEFQKLWPYVKIRKEMADAWTQFMNRLAEEQRLWFPELAVPL